MRWKLATCQVSVGQVPRESRRHCKTVHICSIGAKLNDNHMNNMLSLSLPFVEEFQLIMTRKQRKRKCVSYLTINFVPNKM